VKQWFSHEINVIPYFIFGVLTIKYLILEFGKKKGTKTSHHGLDIVGYRRATYAYTKRCENVNSSESLKIG